MDKVSGVNVELSSSRRQSDGKILQYYLLRPADAGKTEKQVAVYEHPSLADAAISLGIPFYFAKNGIPCLAANYYGIGGTDFAERPTFPRWISDITKIMEELGISGRKILNIIGWSRGGCLALEWARRKPSCCRAVYEINSIPPVSALTSEKRKSLRFLLSLMFNNPDQYLDQKRQEFSQRMNKNDSDYWNGDWDFSLDENRYLARTRLEAVCNNRDWTNYKPGYRVFRSWRSDLKRIPRDVRVGLCHNKRDVTVRPNIGGADALQKLIPQAELLTYESINGSDPHAPTPELLDRIIKEIKS